MQVTSLDEEIVEVLIEWRNKGYRGHQSITGHCELHACERCQIDRLLEKRDAITKTK